MASWMDYFSNPRAHHIKKAMFEVLKERYSQNEPIVDRMSVTLLTDGDTAAFLKMVTDIYEMAYMKAVNDHKEQLQKVGLVARVVPKS